MSKQPKTNVDPHKRGTATQEEVLTELESMVVRMSELERTHDKFRREWPKGMLLAVKEHIRCLSSLTKGKDKLDAKSFIAICEASRAFSDFLLEQKQTVAAASDKFKDLSSTADELFRVAGINLPERQKK